MAGLKENMELDVDADAQALVQLGPRSIEGFISSALTDQLVPIREIMREEISSAIIPGQNRVSQVSWLDADWPSDELQ